MPWAAASAHPRNRVSKVLSPPDKAVARREQSGAPTGSRSCATGLRHARRLEQSDPDRSRLVSPLPGERGPPWPSRCEV